MLAITNNIRNTVATICSEEQFRQTIESDKVAQICAELRDAWEQLQRGEISKDEYEAIKKERKELLPAFFFHAVFKEDKRKNVNAIPTGFSIYDIDHIEAPAEYWAEKQKLLEEKGVAKHVVLAHITPSGNGLRLVFVIPEGMDLAQAQKWMSAMLEDADYDVCVKDFARASFAVPEEYVLLLDVERLFSPERQSMKLEGGDAMMAVPAGETVTGPTGTDAAAVAVADAEATETDAEATEADAEAVAEDEKERLEFRGIPYSDIVDEYLKELCGGMPQQGERNVMLFKTACDLRYIVDDDEEVLFEILPPCGLKDEEMKQLIHSACQRERRLPSKLLDAVMEKLQKEKELDEDDMEKKPPHIPHRLPKLIELLTSCTPGIYKAAVAHAVFPSLAAHLCDTYFCYIDGVWHEATLMNVLMAPTGAGKSCIVEPIKRIMADIRERDAVNLQREKAWKEEFTAKSANKDRSKRPEDLIIQEVDPDITNAALVMRTAESQGHFLYAQMNELRLFDNLSGRNGQQFQIMCLAFDPNNRYGQTRVGTQSITEKVSIRFNWNASTTTSVGRKYFAKVLTDGPISRINFCTIPEREIGAPMPVYGEYPADFNARLKPYIDNLVNAQGYIDCPEAVAIVNRLVRECSDYAKMTQNRVYENLSFRALVIAYLKACVLYVANGNQWEPSMNNFIRWSLHYDLWCKMRFFGAAIEAANNEAVEDDRRGRKSMLKELPNCFTMKDLLTARRAKNMSDAAAKGMIWKWLSRRKIVRNEDGTFTKV